MTLSTIGGRVMSAFTQQTVYDAGRAYLEAGFSVIPLVGKKPAIQWGEYSTRRATLDELNHWHDTGLLQNVGLVMGHVSNGLVCVDLDGLDAVRTFYAHFPKRFHSTLGILSGSLQGRHLYFICENIPPTTRTKNEIGGFELRSNGCYMVAPPSIHPSGNLYQARGLRPIAVVDDLDDIRAWITALIIDKHKAGKTSVPVGISDERTARYVDGAIRNIRRAIATAQEGARNDTLFNGAIQLYQYVAGGILDESRALNELIAAASSCGLPRGETLRTLESARKRGMAEPISLESEA